jgi:transcriptional regulator with XRE-family HTH domain
VNSIEIGDKIKRLRLKLGLTQEELADRSELSKGFISQLERDLTSPSIATLVDILQCLGTTPREFFQDDNPVAKVVFTQAEMFEKDDTDELTGKITWLVPNAQGCQMEPIMLSLASGGATYTDDPHEGEEFGYVLQGSIELLLGSDSYKVKTGESFYYPTNLPHSIKNTGRSQARLIWVSTPPSF